MRAIRHGIIGTISAVLILSGIMLVMPLGSEAEAGGLKEYLKNRVSPKDLRADHEDLEANQGMIKDSLDMLEGNHTMTHE